MERVSFRGCRLAAAAALAGAVIVEIASLFVGATPPHEVLFAVAASPVGMSAFVIFVMTASPRDRTFVFRLILLVAAAVFTALSIAGMGASDAGLIACGSVPISIFAFLIARIASASGDERAVATDALAASSIIGVSALSMVFFLDVSTMYFNPIFDADYVRIDALFGLQPSALVAIAFVAAPPLMWTCLVVYFMLPMAQAYLATIEARTSGRAWGILPAFVVAAIVGYVLYALMPAIGPSAYLGADFPTLHVPLDDLAARPTVDGHNIRGAMPSLHITWAALLCLASLRMPRSVRIAAAVFFVLTLLATLGLGMHYLIDLIVAAPLILLVRALCRTDVPWRGERIVAVAVGTALLAVWVGITRAGLDIEASAGWLTATMIVTCVAPLYLGWRLERADGGTVAGLAPVAT